MILNNALMKNRIIQRYIDVRISLDTVGIGSQSFFYHLTCCPQNGCTWANLWVLLPTITSPGVASGCSSVEARVSTPMLLFQFSGLFKGVHYIIITCEIPSVGGNHGPQMQLTWNIIFINSYMKHRGRLMKGRIAEGNNSIEWSKLTNSIFNTEVD